MLSPFDIAGSRASSPVFFPNCEIGGGGMGRGSCCSCVGEPISRNWKFAETNVRMVFLRVSVETKMESRKTTKVFPEMLGKSTAELVQCLRLNRQIDVQPPV